MKKTVTLLVCATLCILLSFGCYGTIKAAAATDETQKATTAPANMDSNPYIGETELTVNTMESVTAEADIATVYLGVTTSGKSASEAQKENSKISDAFIKAIKRKGVSEDDIRTSNLYVHEDYDNSGSFVVETSFEVTIRDVDKTSTIIETAINAGANNTYSLSFDVSNRDELYLKALSKAVSSATEKAKTTAASAGYKFLGAKSIAEVGYSSYYATENAASASMDSADGGNTAMPVVPGDIEISAQVTGTFIVK